MFLQTFFEPKLDLERLRAMLDTCGPWARANAVRTLTVPQMKALFEGCEAEGLTLDAMVPTGEALVEVGVEYGHAALDAGEDGVGLEFDALAAANPNFKWQLALSEPLPEDHWTGATGFIHDVLR